MPYTEIGKIGSNLGAASAPTGWQRQGDGSILFVGDGVVDKDSSLRSALYDGSDDTVGWKLSGSGEVSLPYRPQMAIERVRDNSSVSVGTTFTNVLLGSIVIPAAWTTYDVEWYGTVTCSDASGGTTGTAVISMRFSIGGTTSGSTHILEMEAQNNHDLHIFPANDWVEGETTVGTSRSVALQMSRSGNAVSSLEATLVVHAYRTS